MNSTIQLSRFRKLVNDVLAAMLQGKRFTKSELNNLIPEGMNKSADDIIRQLQKPWVRINISYQPEKKGQPAYWYIDLVDIQAHQHSPDAYHASLVKQKEDASRKKALSNIIAAKNRYGTAFVENAMKAH
ncbi:hypothetical protein [Vibrio parahaemolyticus]|uniref:hypothetical protein n=1 Tax=Vibrio parahaemolyticus TaxID=670 RepID=UPI00111FB457|nr:hypothetical protein [Vibrio parahaemolyticus]MBE3752123.1 hypothetical protein [Vibrio parahaemolyticus]TOK48043.1 hypothetical protein CGI21_05950 [Vibrio parahaemolyticus]